MKKISDPYITDIIDSINKIFDYMEEINYDKKLFWEDTEKQDAVIRRLEIIGESTKRIEEDFKKQFNNIPWKRMSGLRNVLIHEYDRIDLELVWEVVVKDLPELKEMIIESNT